MSILSRYIFKKILFGTLLLTCVLVLAVWLTQSLRFLDLIVNRGVSIQSYFFFIAFLIPDLLVILLPVCLFISVVFYYHRFQSDHELPIWRSVGLSNLQIAKPALILTSLIVAITFIINVYILPDSFKYFKETEHKLRQQFSTAMMHEGRFNTFGNLTAYVKQRYRSGTMKEIFIHHKTDNPYSIFAHEGKMLVSDGKTFLMLSKGIRQEKDPKTGKLKTLKFDSLTYDLTSLITPSEERKPRPYEKSLSELLSPHSYTDSITKIRYVAAAHQRILHPLYGFMYVLIALNCLLKPNFTRKKRSLPIISAFVIGFVCNMTITFFINLYGKFSLAIFAAYASFLFMTGLSLFLLLSHRLLSFKRFSFKKDGGR